jgi:hypothetical protein
MSVLVPNGRLMPRFLPSFVWVADGVLSEGFGKIKSYETARIAMSRRKCAWKQADEAMWDAIYEMTAPEREEAGRRQRNARS